MAKTAARPLPPSSPYDTYQGMVIETLSPVRMPIEPVGQGDEGEETTEEME